MDTQTIKKLLKKQNRKLSSKVLDFLFICIMLICLTYIIEKEYFFEISQILYCVNVQNLFEIVITMNTILVATIIFFYSIQNNRSIGIPHRAIMAHSFGSFSVPIIFLLTIFILPFIWLLLNLNYKLLALVTSCLAFISQALLVIFILLTVSTRYCILAICNVEIRQFMFLTSLEDEKSENLQRQTIWPFIHKYMAYVVKSDELIVDKANIFRKLLRVPFYKNEESALNFFLPELQKKKIKNIEWLNKDKKWELYSFYFSNLVPVFEFLSNDSQTEERNVYYLILYEFTDELDSLYINSHLPEQFKGNYHIIISAIMNAALLSAMPEKEEFCNYIFKKYFHDKKTRSKQIGLFILFQEFLYSIDKEKIKLSCLDTIKLYIEEWKNDILGSQDQKKMYIEFWDIWSEWSSISRISSYQHLNMALNTIFKETDDSVPITYIMKRKGRKWT